MIRAPTAAEIHAAELRVAHSVENTRGVLDRTRVAVHESLARIATLTMVTGVAAGLALVGLVHWSRMARSARGGRIAKVRRPVIGLIIAFALRYGGLSLPVILRSIRNALSRTPVLNSFTLGYTPPEQRRPTTA